MDLIALHSQKQDKVKIKDSGVKNGDMKLNDQDLRQEEQVTFQLFYSKINIVNETVKSVVKV